MIRGPVLPQLRASLWSLVAGRLDTVETGLRLSLEGLDCSDGQLGLVEGLARDAMGGPVLVLLAIEGDALLTARVLAAGAFLQRVGDGLARAVPEASFCPGVPGRVLVVGTEAAAPLLAQVASLPVPGLQVCTLEPFRIASTERFAVRWLAVGSPHATIGAGLDGGGVPSHARMPDFVVPEAREALWQQLIALIERIDPSVQLHGDRYLRRITWNGHLLGDVSASDGGLVARAVTGVVRDLRSARDVRRFVDQLLRAFLRVAGLEDDAADASNEPHSAAPRHAARDRSVMVAPLGETLRSTLAAAKLSPEEYSALGASSTPDDAHVGQDVAEDGKRSLPPDSARSSVSRAR